VDAIFSGGRGDVRGWLKNQFFSEKTSSNGINQVFLFAWFGHDGFDTEIQSVGKRQIHIATDKDDDRSVTDAMMKLANQLNAVDARHTNVGNDATKIAESAPDAVLMTDKRGTIVRNR